MISETLAEDLIANSILGLSIVIVICMRDLCKRVSHSDCAYDNGLKIKLPTWREEKEDV